MNVSGFVHTLSVCVWGRAGLHDYGPAVRSRRVEAFLPNID
ncbi:MAG TPA: hypothetical protein VF668_01070 [Pyrinomonadaceae bacterium]